MIDQRSDRRRAISSALSFLLVAGSVFWSGVAEAETVMRAAVGLPPSHPGVSHGFQPMVANIPAATKGAITVQPFFGGQLFSLQGSLGGLRNRLADATLLITNNWPAELPHGAFVGEMGSFTDNNLALSGAITEFELLHCRDCLADFARSGAVYTGTYATTPLRLVSRQPIRNLAEFKGKRIRTSGGAGHRWVEALGAVAVKMPGDEALQALGTGVVDGTLHGVGHLKGFSLWDAAKNMNLISSGMFSATATVVYNTEFWRSLPVDQRKALFDEALAASARVTMRYTEIDDEVVPDAKAKGVAFIDAPKDMLDATAAFLRADLKAVADEGVKTYRIPDAKQKLDQFMPLIDKWEKLVGNKGMDVKSYIALMQREVGSRIDPAKFGLD